MEFKLLHFFIKPQSITLRCYNPEYQYVMKNKSEYHKKPTNQKYTGIISEATQKKLQKIIYVWLLSIYITAIYRKNKIKSLYIYPTFITLTLSQKQFHTDKEIKLKILKPFLKSLIRNYNINNYFWRAEKQKNGNIHFHLIADKYIPMKGLNRKWNHYLKINGYTTDYFKTHHNHFPPSTHITKIENLNCMTKYIIKYCSKNSDKQKIEGRQYSLSSNLVNLVYYNDELEGNLEHLIYDYIEKNKHKAYECDYAKAFYFERFIDIFQLPKTLKNRLITYYLNVFDLLYTANNAIENNTKSQALEPLSIDTGIIREKQGKIEF